MHFHVLFIDGSFSPVSN
ncbi:MAG: hypothetical protein AB8B97_08460 [Granulosicoccus sp.]